MERRFTITLIIVWVLRVIALITLVYAIDTFINEWNTAVSANWASLKKELGLFGRLVAYFIDERSPAYISVKYFVTSVLLWGFGDLLLLLRNIANHFRGVATVTEPVVVSSILQPYPERHPMMEQPGEAAPEVKPEE